MKLLNVKKGIFVDRPNRFIANVEVDGRLEICHVKNTGRCRELLVKGTRVLLQESDNQNRRTRLDLVGVYKGGELFSIDSQAPNKVFGEWLKESSYFGDISFIKPETKFGNSRFDFYFEYGKRKAFAEVKGVTLERDGVFLFPDAPTERGVKHLRELCECKKQGFEAYAVFVIQANFAKYFTPNRETHPEFAEALLEAKESGVKILAFCCDVCEDEIKIKDFVDVRI